MILTLPSSPWSLGPQFIHLVQIAFSTDATMGLILGNIALMSLFILLIQFASTVHEEAQGIQDYINPTLKILGFGALVSISVILTLPSSPIIWGPHLIHLTQIYLSTNEVTAFCFGNAALVFSSLLFIRLALVPLIKFTMNHASNTKSPQANNTKERIALALDEFDPKKFNNTAKKLMNFHGDLTLTTLLEADDSDINLRKKKVQQAKLDLNLLALNPISRIWSGFVHFIDWFYHYGRKHPIAMTLYTAVYFMTLFDIFTPFLPWHDFNLSVFSALANPQVISLLTGAIFTAFFLGKLTLLVCSIVSDRHRSPVFSIFSKLLDENDYHRKQARKALCGLLLGACILTPIILGQIHIPWVVAHSGTWLIFDLLMFNIKPLILLYDTLSDPDSSVLGSCIHIVTLPIQCCFLKHGFRRLCCDFCKIIPRAILSILDVVINHICLAIPHILVRGFFETLCHIERCFMYLLQYNSGPYPLRTSYIEKNQAFEAWHDRFQFLYFIQPLHTIENYLDRTFYNNLSSTVETSQPSALDDPTQSTALKDKGSLLSPSSPSSAQNTSKRKREDQRSSMIVTPDAQQGMLA
ncbi:MAG: hypothetical protein CMF51_02205 [Legionellales bacterium]|nr:hypothetical protein [Legionellales bacterium]